MCENRFYICRHCGNLIGLINDAGVPMTCCGEKMTLLEPGTSDASAEKHVPVVSVSENTVNVTVGEAAHPMTPEHSILWVYLRTDRGGQRKCLTPGSCPSVSFALTDETPIEVYAYCNLHGLWKADVKAPAVCPLRPVDAGAKENYTVCFCNNVSYFDILDAIHSSDRLEKLLDVFENVKNTTHCTTGCGGCYERVMAIISDVMANGEA